VRGCQLRVASGVSGKRPGGKTCKDLVPNKKEFSRGARLSYPVMRYVSSVSWIRVSPFRLSHTATHNEFDFT